MKLLIYPTTRKVREFYANNLSQNALLDKVLSAGEFFEKIILNDKRKADDYETLLLMKKACDMTRSANSSDFAKLAIPSEFFTFLKNNEYLFSFFKELALSKKQISDLQKNDYYAQYNEHLAILNELQKNYFMCLKNANLHDDITLCEDYKINEDFLGEFSEIDFFLEGFLNEFEL